VGPGDAVAAGDVLVELDRSVWTEQAADADAALNAAEAAHARAQRLVDQGILPRRDLEAATAELARVRAVAVDARRTLARATLRSPIRGSVSTVSASLAQPVGINDVLVEVVDPSALEALVRLSADDAARVTVGDAVTLTGGLDLAAPPIALGRVTGVSPSVDPLTGTVTARVAIDPSQGIRAGQRVSARIVVAMHPGAVVVPRGALVPSATGTSVFVVDSAGAAHATAVTLGAEAADSVEILSGLARGDRIVTAGAFGMVDGVRVQRAPAR
jgi:RND family efflux transporter MFP subunit